MKKARGFVVFDRHIFFHIVIIILSAWCPRVPREILQYPTPDLPWDIIVSHAAGGNRVI